MGKFNQYTDWFAHLCNFFVAATASFTMGAFFSAFSGARTEFHKVSLQQLSKLNIQTSTKKGTDK
jgi:hypothetical protein